jgi:phosphoglucosamine mutase
MRRISSIRWPRPSKLGRASRLDDAPGRYIEAAKAAFPRGRSLERAASIAVDCANGAAYKVAPTVLWELGAEVVPIGVSPDGFNINRRVRLDRAGGWASRCGNARADLGIALDGDADRLVAVRRAGACCIDGDQLMAMIAGAWHRAGRLRAAAWSPP